MRFITACTLALLLTSSAAHAQDEDTCDLPSPSVAGRSSPQPERDTPREPSAATGHEPMRLVVMLNGFVGAYDFERTTITRWAVLSPDFRVLAGVGLMDPAEKRNAAKHSPERRFPGRPGPPMTRASWRPLRRRARRLGQRRDDARRRGVFFRT
jgi:hypothetical protein